MSALDELKLHAQNLDQIMISIDLNALDDYTKNQFMSRFIDNLNDQMIVKDIIKTVENAVLKNNIIAFNNTPDNLRLANMIMDSTHIFGASHGVVINFIVPSSKTVTGFINQFYGSSTDTLATLKYIK